MIQAARIRREQAIEQLGRFEGYPSAPSTENHRELEELIQAFQQASKSAGSAQIIGDRLKRRLKFFPRVADIWEAALAIEAELAAASTVKEFEGVGVVHCQACQDTGYVRSEPVERDGVEYSQVRLCEVCRRKETA